MAKETLENTTARQELKAFLRARPGVFASAPKASKLAAAWFLSVGWLLGLAGLGGTAQAATMPGVHFEEVRISNGSEPPLVAGIWRPAGGKPGHGLPLVVLSHGGAAAYQVHADTAIALARAGFVAAAVSHAGDTYDDQSHVMELWRRPQQLHRLISYMLEEWPGRRTLNPKQVGAFGFSNGGFTVLVSAGGVPNLDLIGPYCQDHPDHDLCTALKQAGVDPVHPPIHVPPNAWVSDGRIKAVVVAAPAFGFTFSGEGLSGLRVPVQLWRAADDRHQPAPYYEDAVRAVLPGPVDYHVVPLAGHFAFLPACDERLAAAQPAICKDAPGFDRTAFHETLNAEIVRFLRAHLGH
jgi:predicted dienelactone hydrolase